jgi:hypothetical protein
LAEDGIIPVKYTALLKTSSEDYLARTEAKERVTHFFLKSRPILVCNTPVYPQPKACPECQASAN